ncbi:MAG: DUF998 domain-containing protein [Candidatus Hydrogenedens sp.]|nr:DUF998 domain-containing protein [Candidatus Hydrogenedens sp.]
MNLRSFWRGEFSPRAWQRLSLLLILQFQGMLWTAWFLRSPHVAESTPFRNVISTLGQGRMDGNTGAWMFDCAFCTFALLLIPWHLHLARRVSHVSKGVGKALVVVGFISLIGVACVAIFDEQQMGPVSKTVSQVMHGLGAITAFGGHCIGAFLSWYIFASIYARTPGDSRGLMAHPVKLLVSVLAMVPPLVLLCMPQLYEAGNHLTGAALPEFVWRLPFWQWSLMVTLMLWLYSMSRWYPDTLTPHPEPATSNA